MYVNYIDFEVKQCLTCCVVPVYIVSNLVCPLLTGGGEVHYIGRYPCRCLLHLRSLYFSAMSLLFCFNMTVLRLFLETFYIKMNGEEDIAAEFDFDA